jgi:diaminopimelate epimerase
LSANTLKLHYHFGAQLNYDLTSAATHLNASFAEKYFKASFQLSLPIKLKAIRTKNSAVFMSNKLIKFTKMHGLGNDFVIINAVSQNIKLDKKQIIALADRHFGLGCDQVLVLHPPHQLDQEFFFRIYNANGEEAELCGNGARCLARYVFEEGLTQKIQFVLGSIAGNLTVSLDALPAITLTLPLTPPAPNFVSPLPKISAHSYELTLNTQRKAYVVFGLGNPHCVIPVPDIQDISLITLGEQLQSHPALLQGSNVEVMQVLARNHIKLRIFERGVGETLACGSGASAAVIAGIENEALSDAVKVDMPGGHLSLHWPPGTSSIEQTGPTRYVFHGECLVAKATD